MKTIGSTKRIVFLCLGWFFFALGVIGAFLPLLPTTPFLLLTAYFFARSSPRWHQWLLRQPHLGKLILDWQNHGVIRTKVKILATSMMIPLLTVSLMSTRVPLIGQISAAVTCAAVLVFIWTRPGRAKL
jgi:uncharacterized membrane protein YbaN (DUF454 family)